MVSSDFNFQAKGEIISFIKNNDLEAKIKPEEIHAKRRVIKA